LETVLDALFFPHDLKDALWRMKRAPVQTRFLLSGGRIGQGNTSDPHSWPEPFFP
jgi:hypothetical protein